MYCYINDKKQWFDLLKSSKIPNRCKSATGRKCRPLHLHATQFDPQYTAY